MGLHFSASKLAGNAPFRPQHWIPWFGVWVMSWSMNCPICITSTVFSVSRGSLPVLRELLTDLAEGSSELSTELRRGKSKEFRAYSGSRIRWKGVPVRPKLELVGLLQEPSKVLYLSVMVGQDGPGTQGHLDRMSALVSLLKSFLRPIPASKSVKLFCALSLLVASRRTWEF